MKDSDPPKTGASTSSPPPKLELPFHPDDLPSTGGFPDDAPSSIRKLASTPPPPETTSEIEAPATHDSAPPPPEKGGYQHRSTVAAKAFRGLFWMATTGIGSRVVSLISTLLLTRYVLPEDYGDVQNSFIVCWMVDLITQLGLPQ